MIYVECNPDKALVSALGFDQKGILHTYGKGNACKTLLRNKGHTALLDEDPLSAQHSYLQGLTLRGEQYGLRLLSDSQRGNRVVLICPRLEEWLVRTAKIEKVGLAQYGLPSDARTLHEVLAFEQKKLRDLIGALEKSVSMKLLQQWLKKGK